MKGRSAIATLIATAFTLLPISGVAAYAASPDDFPPIGDAPAWYATAGSATYSTVTAASTLLSEADEGTESKAYWYAPSGAAPSSREGGVVPDIIIDTGTIAAAGSARDLLVVATSDAFPEMTRSLGTTLTEGVALPKSGVQPDLVFPGHGIVVASRPQIDCTRADDPREFKVEAALLGDNGHKYLVELNLVFEDRNAQKRSLCETTERVTEQATSEATPTPEPTTTAAHSAEGHETPTDTNTNVGELLLVALLAFVALLLVAGYLMFRRTRGSAPHHPDGRRRDASQQSEEQP